MSREVAYAVYEGGASTRRRLHRRRSSPTAGSPSTPSTPARPTRGWASSDHDPGRAMLFGRWGEPDDAARLVAWLCSDDARWITGQVIDSEGGFRRWA